MEIILDNIFRGQLWTNYLFLLTGIVGLCQYKKFRILSLRLFILAFAYFALSDFLSLFYGRTWGGGSNALIFNISYIISFASLFYIFHSHISSRRFQLFIKYMFGVYILLVFVDLLFLNFDYHKEYQVWPYVVGGITVLISVLFYFYEVLNSEKLVALERNFIFWVGVGYFFYFLAKVPFVVKKNVYTNNPEYLYMFELNIIMTIILRISLIIGFLWSRNQEKS
ncbi:MAG: hypothetical protein JKY22_03280 [Flavobacteriaceae bacterium]|nr:hypothetical protein [Flavobacteriaceae bacterium]